ncbi:hypothetical protein GCM10009727_10550 [Actinomadura napierensis]|uniref:DUF4132 domain-containing protein n=1 Tax=Actinomadura napierensis TaxID=267854 RepID=A0ABN2Y8U3_9ACTN
MFADYEILQPFPQLGRGVHALTEEEKAADHLERFEGLTVPTGVVLGLERLGWARATPDHHNVQDTIARALPDGLLATIHLHPGIEAGDPRARPEQTLRLVSLAEAPGTGPTRTGHTFAKLDDLTASELLGHLTHLTRSAP